MFHVPAHKSGSAGQVPGNKPVPVAPLDLFHSALSAVLHCPPHKRVDGGCVPINRLTF